MPTRTIFFQHVPVDSQPPQLHPDAAVRPHQHRQHQHRRHRLGDDGGPGHTGHAHVEPDHKQQVQPGIQHRRHHQKIEGPPGVAHGPENAGAHVIDQQARDAGEIDGQIRRGLRQHLRRGVHQVQHGRDQGQAQGRERRAQHQGQHHGRVDGIPDLFGPVGPVILADDHPRAAGQAHKEADEHIDDGPHGAHGGKGLVGHKVAHHPGVHHVVKLLEHVSGQQRQGELDQVAGDAALGHVHVPPGRGVMMAECHKCGSSVLSFYNRITPFPGEINHPALWGKPTIDGGTQIGYTGEKAREELLWNTLP